VRLLLAAIGAVWDWCKAIMTDDDHNQQYFHLSYHEIVIDSSHQLAKK